MRRGQAKTRPYHIYCEDHYHGKGTTLVHLYFTLPLDPEDEGVVDAPSEDDGYCTCMTPAGRKALKAEARKLASRPEPGKATLRLVDYPEPECKGQQRCK